MAGSDWSSKTSQRLLGDSSDFPHFPGSEGAKPGSRRSKRTIHLGLYLLSRDSASNLPFDKQPHATIEGNDRVRSTCKRRERFQRSSPMHVARPNKHAKAASPTYSRSQIPPTPPPTYDMCSPSTQRGRPCSARSQISFWHSQIGTGCLVPLCLEAGAAVAGTAFLCFGAGQTSSVLECAWDRFCGPPGCDLASKKLLDYWKPSILVWIWPFAIYWVHSLDDPC